MQCAQHSILFFQSGSKIKVSGRRTGSAKITEKQYYMYMYYIETLHERRAQIFRHLLFEASYNVMAGIGSRACRLHVPAVIL